MLFQAFCLTHSNCTLSSFSKQVSGKHFYIHLTSASHRKAVGVAWANESNAVFSSLFFNFMPLLLSWDSHKTYFHLLFQVPLYLNSRDTGTMSYTRKPKRNLKTFSHTFLSSLQIPVFFLNHIHIPLHKHIK